MTADDDSRDADGEQRYRVGPKGLDGAAVDVARAATGCLTQFVERLTSQPPLCVRVLESGTVRTEVFAEDAMRVVALLRSVAGSLPEGVVFPEAEPVAVPGGEVDYPIHPTLYAMRPGVDYEPGLAAAFAARAALRDVLRSVLPRGPLAVVPLANVYGRGIVRFDLTPADAERMALLVSYVCERLERGQRFRS